MSRRVLITGGCGFIGRQTIEPLVAGGFEVSLTSRTPPPAEIAERVAARHGRLSHHVVDLLDPAATTALVEQVRPTHLLHLAWDTRHGVFWTSDENQRWVDASCRLLEAFTRCGGARCVAAGTCVEYAPADTPLAEATAVLEPTTPYGRAKLAFRTALVEASIQHGFSAAWGRVFHLFGPHEQPARLVPAAITSLLAGRPFDATAGSQIRDYSSVVDVAAAFAAVLDSTLTGDVNVASGTATSVARVLQIVGEIIGRPELIGLARLPTPPHDVPVLIADASRLRRRFPHLFAVDLEERLSETVEWWRRQSQRG
jgi:nucleoside-diphosphate-sugar epimerase